MVPQMDEFGLNKAFEDAEGKDGLTFVKWDASKGREYNINNAQDANIGITFPLMGIAETATLVQPMISGSGRSVGLLPIHPLLPSCARAPSNAAWATPWLNCARCIRRIQQDSQARSFIFPAILHVRHRTRSCRWGTRPVNITYVIVKN